MKNELKLEIIEDFRRARQALASAKRNFEEDDLRVQADYGRRSRIVEFS